MPLYSVTIQAGVLSGEAKVKLGPVDKPVLAPARPERLGLHDTHVATGVTR